MTRIEIVGDSISHKNEPNWFTQDLVKFIPEVSDKRISVEAVQLPSESADAVVFCRTTEQGLKEAIQVCNDRSIPLIYLSTDVKFPDVELKTSVIVAPNSSIDAAIFQATVTEKVRLLISEGLEPGDILVTIDEYHQRFKKTTSGYAQDISRVLDSRLGVDCKIKSHRDWAEAQAKFKIPPEHELGYAVHDAAIQVGKHGNFIEKARYKLEVLGRKDYAAGVLATYCAATNPRLSDHFPPGVIRFTDLVKEGIVTS